MTEVSLRVSDSQQKDVGRGFARIDQRTMRRLGISAGDTVEVTAKRTTSATAMPASGRDDNQGIIRIDGFTRKNAGVDIDENVTIRPASVRPATKITLAPIDTGLNADKDLNINVRALNSLIDRTFVQGDTVLVMMLGQLIPFTVYKTVPDGVVKVTLESQIRARKM